MARMLRTPNILRSYDIPLNADISMVKYGQHLQFHELSELFMFKWPGFVWKWGIPSNISIWISSQSSIQLGVATKSDKATETKNKLGLPTNYATKPPNQFPQKSPNKNQTNPPKKYPKNQLHQLHQVTPSARARTCPRPPGAARWCHPSPWRRRCNGAGHPSAPGCCWCVSSMSICIIHISSTYRCIYVHMYVCMYVWMDGWMDVCMYVRTYVRTYVRMYTCI